MENSGFLKRKWGPVWAGATIGAAVTGFMHLLAEAFSQSAAIAGLLVIAFKGIRKLIATRRSN